MPRCVYCRKETVCHSSHLPSKVVIEERSSNGNKTEHTYILRFKGCSVVCGNCLEVRRKEIFHETPADVHVKTLIPKENHGPILPPAIGWQCQNPKHQRTVKYKGKKTGMKGKVHFSHDHEPCPDCDPRDADPDGTRVNILPWPPLEGWHYYVMPCLHCGGSGLIWT